MANSGRCGANSGQCGDQQWPLWWPLQWPTVAGVGLTVASVMANSGRYGGRCSGQQWPVWANSGQCGGQQWQVCGPTVAGVGANSGWCGANSGWCGADSGGCGSHREDGAVTDSCYHLHHGGHHRTANTP